MKTKERQFELNVARSLEVLVNRIRRKEIKVDLEANRGIVEGPASDGFRTYNFNGHVTLHLFIEPKKGK